MEIALQRIQHCVNGRLDLTNLGLSELPPLPENLTELRCCRNQLTTLPELPSSLQTLYCSCNQLTSIPSLPSSLETFTCLVNQLTTLPSLPTSLSMMMCDYNQLTALPELPHLSYLSCSGNQLTSLPSLPHGLTRLYCSSNELETLPELPSTLVGLACVLPYNDRIYISNEMTPDIVQELNQENEKWMDPYKKERCMKRCLTYKEEIMMKTWHPSRVEMLLEMGYDVEDM
jgi:hypothetical protein